MRRQPLRAGAPALPSLRPRVALRHRLQLAARDRRLPPPRRALLPLRGEPAADAADASPGDAPSPVALRAMFWAAADAAGAPPAGDLLAAYAWRLASLAARSAGGAAGQSDDAPAADGDAAAALVGELCAAAVFATEAAEGRGARWGGGLRPRHAAALLAAHGATRLAAGGGDARFLEALWSDLSLLQAAAPHELAALLWGAARSPAAAPPARWRDAALAAAAAAAPAADASALASLAWSAPRLLAGGPAPPAFVAAWGAASGEALALREFSAAQLARLADGAPRLGPGLGAAWWAAFDAAAAEAPLETLSPRQLAAVAAAAAAAAPEAPPPPPALVGRCWFAVAEVAAAGWPDAAVSVALAAVGRLGPPPEPAAGGRLLGALAARPPLDGAGAPALAAAAATAVFTLAPALAGGGRGAAAARCDASHLLATAVAALRPGDLPAAAQALAALPIDPAARKQAAAAAAGLRRRMAAALRGAAADELAPLLRGLSALAAGSASGDDGGDAAGTSGRGDAAAAAAAVPARAWLEAEGRTSAGALRALRGPQLLSLLAALAGAGGLQPGLAFLMRSLDALAWRFGDLSAPQRGQAAALVRRLGARPPPSLARLLPPPDEGG